MTSHYLYYPDFSNFLMDRLGVITKEEADRIKKFVYKVNNELFYNMLKMRTIILPYDMGTVRLYEHTKRVKNYKGKYYTNQSTNLYLTEKLWEEDEEAKKNKTKVLNDGTWFDVAWTKPKRDNIQYYTLVLQTDLQKELGKMNAGEL